MIPSQQKATLHQILLDAKSEIKGDVLIDHTGEYCSGICDYAKWSKNGSSFMYELCSNLYRKSPFYRGNSWVAPAFDFANPKRLALLDWLIEQTKP